MTLYDAASGPDGQDSCMGESVDTAGNKLDCTRRKFSVSSLHRSYIVTRINGGRYLQRSTEPTLSGLVQPCLEHHTEAVEAER